MNNFKREKNNFPTKMGLGHDVNLFKRDQKIRALKGLNNRISALLPA